SLAPAPTKRAASLRQRLSSNCCPPASHAIVQAVKEPLERIRELEEHISAAEEYAEECKGRALSTIDEGFSTELADLEEGWLDPATDFERLKRLQDVLLRRSRFL